MDLRIEDVGYGGLGIGRSNGKVVMVAGVLPGETVRVAVRRCRPRWDDADLLEIVTPSPERIEPVCPLAFRAASAGSLYCPGCVYQQVAYPAERALKQRQLTDLLGRWAGVETVIEDGGGDLNDAVLGYRNKIIWQARRQSQSLKLGYVANRRDQIIDVPQCFLAHPELNAAAAAWRQQPEFGALRDGERVTFRYTRPDGALVWVNPAPDNAVWLREETVLGLLAVPRGAFFQVHPTMAGRLVSWVSRRLAQSTAATVVDLFCGVGIFALAAAVAGKQRVIGVDADGPAIRAARYNADCLGLTGVEFVPQPVAAALPDIARRVPAAEVLAVLDPPRAGLQRATMAGLRQWAPREILLISCAPDTMCRDLNALLKAGYRIERLAWFDMFPRTAGFETVVWLRR